MSNAHTKEEEKKAKILGTFFVNCADWREAGISGHTARLLLRVRPGIQLQCLHPPVSQLHGDERGC
mgnify:CR=1 FL=1